MNDVATRLVQRARAGEGPAFLQADTYRYSGHHVGDINREYYRSKQEEQHWKTERDPIKLHGELADRRRDMPMQPRSNRLPPKRALRWKRP